ncbi:MAG: alpha/beta fold hydrolase [Planctomycetota bacterium]|jgi:acetyl esterase/lipase
MFRRHTWVTLALVGLGVAAPAALAAPPSSPARHRPPPNVRHETNIVYRVVGDTQLELDLAMPKDAVEPLPAIVCFHGGLWRRGSRTMCTQMTFFLAQEGYVAVTVTYRLAPEHRFPAQIQDVKCAVRWLRANADRYHIDPQRIGAFGLSAGGHLALLLATTDEKAGLEPDCGDGAVSTRVQAAVSYSGPTDLAADYWQRLATDLLGAPYADKPGLYSKASPITYADASDPPVLIFHGTADLLVPLDQSQRFTDKLRDAGVSAALRVLEGAGHVWADSQLVETRVATIRFFDEQFQARTGPGQGAQSER